MEEIKVVLGMYESNEDKISFLLRTIEQLKKDNAHWKGAANTYHQMLQENTDTILELQQTNERYEKLLKEIFGYTKYEGNQWYEKLKRELQKL